MPRLPPLESLRIFSVAARHLSFTEAAAELNLTQSAISHRVRSLEEELGLVLFERLPRRMQLTATGRLLGRKIGLAISEIERSVAEIRNGNQVRPLKLTMLPSVASHWLIPRLHYIRSRCQDLNVQLVADPRPLDLRAERIDLAIRFCREPNPSYAVTRLMGDRVFPVCAPELMERYGPVESIDSLLKLPLLHDSAAEEDASETGWRSWLDHHGRLDATIDIGQHFNDASLLVNAAMLGLGVALARGSLVTDQLASGRLMCPLGLSAPAAYTYYLLGLPEAAESLEIAMFRDALLEAAAATEACVLSVGAHALARSQPIRASHQPSLATP